MREGDGMVRCYHRQREKVAVVMMEGGGGMVCPIEKGVMCVSR
jgi:dethiobiotin synthetase